MAREENWYWVAYPCYVEKVKIVSKTKSGREIFDKIKTPYTVVNEEEEEFVIDKSFLHNSPVTAEERSAALQQQYEVNCGEEEEGLEGLEGPEGEPDEED